MQIGRFFSLEKGRMGQYLSPRVLVVRSPFRQASLTGESVAFCCFGFSNLRQAQKFLRSLHHPGLSVELRQSQLLSDCPYEVVIDDRVDLARTLANWERQTTAWQPKFTAVPARSMLPVAA